MSIVAFLNAELDGDKLYWFHIMQSKILKEPWFNVGDKVRILMKASAWYNQIGRTGLMCTGTVSNLSW